MKMILYHNNNCSKSRECLNILTKKNIDFKVRHYMKESIVAVASSSHQDKKTAEWLHNNKIFKTVSVGSSLKFCLLACGEADVYPRFGPTMEWDTAAGDAVLRAAGGKVENINGTKFKYGKKNFKNTSFIAKGDF